MWCLVCKSNFLNGQLRRVGRCDDEVRFKAWTRSKRTAHIFYDICMLDCVDDKLGKWEGGATAHCPGLPDFAAYIDGMYSNEI